MNAFEILILLEDGRDDGVAVSADVFPAALHILDDVAGETGLRVNQVFCGPTNERCLAREHFASIKRQSLEGLDDASVQSGNAVGPGGLSFSSERSTEFLSEDFQGNGSELLSVNRISRARVGLEAHTHIEHDGSSPTSKVSTAKGVELVGQQLAAGQRLDDHVQTGQDGVGLSQEVAVAQELVLRYAGEGAEHLLVLGMSLDEAEQDLGGHVTIFAGLFPRLADDGAVSGAQDARVIGISGRDRGGGGRRGHRGNDAAGLFTEKVVFKANSGNHYQSYSILVAIYGTDDS